jgi:hypothetical protein
MQHELEVTSIITKISSVAYVIISFLLALLISGWLQHSCVVGRAYIQLVTLQCFLYVCMAYMYGSSYVL